MTDKPADRIELGSTEIPPALTRLAEALPRFAGDDLESQLQSLDIFLAVLSPAARPRMAALLRDAASRAFNDVVARRIMAASLSVASGGRAAAPRDHEAAMRAYRAAHDAAHPHLARAGDEDSTLLARIEEALSEIEPMGAAGWAPAVSVARQLCWCRGFVRGEAVEEAPGPFSMGLIATRGFDMWGDKPELAGLINDIERRILARRAARDLSTRA